jgi:hypothetical protein
MKLVMRETTHGSYKEFDGTLEELQAARELMGLVKANATVPEPVTKTTPDRMIPVLPEPVKEEVKATPAKKKPAPVDAEIVLPEAEPWTKESKLNKYGFPKQWEEPTDARIKSGQPWRVVEVCNSTNPKIREAYRKYLATHYHVEVALTKPR